MNTRQLKYALKLAKELNFSLVAEHLNITQPALSKQILNLEKELGVKLFDRDKTPIRLTPAGEYFVREAEELIYKEEQLLRSMDQFQSGEQGQLVVGISPFRSLYMIPNVVKKVQEKYPGVQICLRENGSETLRKEAAEGEYDLAIINLPVDEAVLDVEPLEPDSLVLAVPNSLLHLLPDSQEKGMNGIEFAKCKELPFISEGHNQELRHLFDYLTAKAEIHPHIAMEVVGVSTALAMVKAGIGATLLPLQFMNKDAIEGQITLFTLEDDIFARQPVVVTRRGQYISESAEYMIELLKEMYGCPQG